MEYLSQSGPVEDVSDAVEVSAVAGQREALKMLFTQFGNARKSVSSLLYNTWAQHRSAVKLICTYCSAKHIYVALHESITVANIREQEVMAARVVFEMCPEDKFQESLCMLLSELEGRSSGVIEFLRSVERKPAA